MYYYMLAVQTYINANVRSLENTLKTAEYSVSLLKQHGLCTRLYTEEELVPFFSNFQYDEIVPISKMFKKLVYPEFVFGITPLYTTTLINEPFIHVDFDCFIFKKDIIDELKTKQIFYLHDEFPDNEKYLSIINKVSQNVTGFKNIKLDQSPVMRNTGIFGGINFLNIKHVCKCVFHEFVKNQNYFKSLNCPSFYISQTFPFYMLRDLNQPYTSIVDAPSIDTLFENLLDRGIVHYWEAATYNKKMLYKLNFLNNDKLKKIITNLI